MYACRTRQGVEKREEMGTGARGVLYTVSHELSRLFAIKPLNSSKKVSEFGEAWLIAIDKKKIWKFRMSFG